MLVLWLDQKGSDYVHSTLMPHRLAGVCGLECYGYQPELFMHIYSPASNSLTVHLIQLVNQISQSMLPAILVSIVINEKKKFKKIGYLESMPKKVNITILI